MSMSISLAPVNMLGDLAKGNEDAGGSKIANQLTLGWEDYPGLSSQA